MKVIINESPFDERYGMQLEIPKLVSEKNIRNKRVLDIGCGFGWFEHWATQQKVKKITGIDVSTEEIALAKNLRKSSVNFIVGSAIKLPFKENTFDTVVSWEVLEHIPKNTESLMFSEVFRVLKPGGKFFLSTPHANIIATLFDPAWWLIAHRHYKTMQVRSFAQLAGFTKINLTVRGGIFNVIHPINLYVAKWIFKRDEFFKKYISKKLSEEFSRQDGFTNIICVCKKP